MFALKTKPAYSNQHVHLDDLEIVDGTLSSDNRQYDQKRQHTTAKSRGWLQKLMGKQQRKSR